MNPDDPNPSPPDLRATLTTLTAISIELAEITDPTRSHPGVFRCAQSAIEHLHIASNLLNQLPEPGSARKIALHLRIAAATAIAANLAFSTPQGTTPPITADPPPPPPIAPPTTRHPSHPYSIQLRPNDQGKWLLDGPGTPTCTLTFPLHDALSLVTMLNRAFNLGAASATPPDPNSNA